jgi:uroporphyrinogen-III synthase
VLVTRASHQASKLSDGLRALGAEPVEVPVLEIRPPDSFAALDGALENLGGYDWLVLTSSNTVKCLRSRADELGLGFTPPKGLKVAAIGEATAEAARHEGFQITLIPESYVAESLVDDLVGQIAGKRVLLARAATARDVLPDGLRAGGATVDIVDAYRNVLPENAPELLRLALTERVDAATFTSSSSVTRLEEAVQRAGFSWPLEGVSAISIGPITSETLRSEGWEPAAEADPSDIAGLIAAVVRVLGRK